MISIIILKELSADGSVRHMSEIEMETMGKVEIVIDRKDDGSLFLASASVEKNEFWREVETLSSMLKDMHQHMVETNIRFQHVYNTLFALKRYL